MFGELDEVEDVENHPIKSFDYERVKIDVE